MNFSCTGAVLLLLMGALLPVVAPAGQPGDGNQNPDGTLIMEEPPTRALSLVSIAGNIHVALGQGGAAMAMIEGRDGLVIIDSLATEAATAQAMAAFRDISDKPVAGVILTHLHRDHSGGLGVVASEDIPVYSRAATVTSTSRAPTTFPHGIEEAGELAIRHWEPTLRQPISDRHPVTIAGIRLELVAAHGDNSQQLWIWYPDRGALFSGDAFYTSFPAIHALRDTVRESRDWITTLDAMLEQSPRFLISSHGYPIVGQVESVNALKNYRDTIALVVEETLDGIARGLDADALVTSIHLPLELSSQPYLEERFARLIWAIRAIHSDRRGWFDGNPTNLDPLPGPTLASRIAELAGGPEVLLENGMLALDNGDYRWAAQLADYLLNLDAEDAPAMHMKADALVGLAQETDNLPARDFYLKAARELRRGAGE